MGHRAMRFTTFVLVSSMAVSVTHGQQLRIAFDPPQELFHGAGVHTYGLAIADFDKDNDLDLMTGNSIDRSAESPNFIWLNNGNGVFTDSGIRLGVDHTRNIALGDLDNDNDLDAVFANPGSTTSRIWWATPLGFVQSDILLGNGDSLSVALGDLDGNMKLDVVIGNLASQQDNDIWFQDESAMFMQSPQSINGRTHSLKLGHLNDDEYLDLFIGNSGGPDEVWLNNGLGEFVNSEQSLGNSTSWSVALGDLNGDSFTDAFVGTQFNSSLMVWLNNGNGEFTSTRQEFGVSDQANQVALGDLDGDGDLDAVSANGDHNGKQMDHIWINDGTGHFSDSGIQFPIDHAHSVSIADLNGDSGLDIVIGGMLGAPTRVYLNSLLLVGDINADKLLDSQDIDLLRDNIGGDPIQFDLTADGFVTPHDVSYLITSILKTTSGDANLDRHVNLADFAILKKHFGQAGVGWGQGDFDGNDVVGLDDFGLLKQNFGFENANPVPEPSTWVQAAISFGLLMFCCSRNWNWSPFALV